MILVSCSASWSGFAGNACRRSWYEVQKEVWAVQRIPINLGKKLDGLDRIGCSGLIVSVRQLFHSRDRKPRVKLVHPIWFCISISVCILSLEFGGGTICCCPSHESMANKRNFWNSGGVRYFLQSDVIDFGSCMRNVIASGSSHRRRCSNVSWWSLQCGQVGSVQCCPPAFAFLAGVASWL